MDHSSVANIMIMTSAYSRFSNVLESGSWDHLSVNLQVYDIANLDTILWIHIPNDLSLSHQITDIAQKVGSKYESIDLTDGVDRTGQYPWVSIDCDKLDMNVGQHIYRITLINTVSLNKIYLYFTYIVQDDDPEKPYIYMENGNPKCGCEITG